MASTLEDVARYAGVSIATASRVFNAKPNVAEDTRLKVNAAIDHLGYAGQQRTGQEHLRVVGVVVPDVDSSVFREAVRILSATLASSGISSVIVTVDGTPEAERRALDLLVERRMSGVVVFDGDDGAGEQAASPWAELRERGIPVLTIGGREGIPHVASVRWDDGAAVRAAADCLVTHGHRSIALVVGDDDRAATERRVEAFRDYCDQAEGPERVTGMIEHSATAGADVERLAVVLAQRGATAVIAETEWIATSALRALRRSGHRVPQDVSLICLEDSRMLAAVDPPVTAMRQSVELLARTAALELVRQLGGRGAQAHALVFGSELILRSTVAVR
ncbi:LacI family DNA-binding transcriptional regulator [Galbitalea soli]|uniref:LacI family transcriptional regulator n=1 Tax=Galbitalea soli TaxID=1268042 RepID=A0A7C9PML5_9MICO|nr:LacI family DNA-binding transcriptional regulator [Galbitalea soli]NEM91050.1 LacI family transcriptional regulator [Galbitalea soli]NYJ29738.1 DNA-binding LacI/PurR family transcriptional regulator [Galbitalea soli]